MTFLYSSSSTFYPVLRKRVDRYFTDHDLRKSGNVEMAVKALILMGVQLASYLSVLFVDAGGINITAWVFLGISTALIAINFCHDAIHGALFSKRKWNDLFGLLFNIYGANQYIWRITHNQLHHNFTNIQEHDSDLDLSMLLKVTPVQEARPFHRFQHVYAFVLYSFSSFCPGTGYGADIQFRPSGRGPGISRIRI